MKSKQIIGIIIAGVVFACVGVMSVVSNYLAESAINSSKNILSSVTSELGEMELPYDDFVGVVKIEGTISEDIASSSIFSTYLGYDHQGRMDFIESMMYAENNKGILLDINSPGGYMYETDELYDKLMEYKEVTGRPIYAYFGKTAASGGYYVGMAADQIYMNKMGTTGSIGVIISTVNTAGLYEKLGIEEVNITSGKNKAMGSPGQHLSEEQKAIYQSTIDEAYGYFVDVVETGRGLDEVTVKNIADGRIYTAQQALDLKLIDQIAYYDDAVEDITSQLGYEYISFYEPSVSGSYLFSSVFGVVNQFRPMSQAEVLDEYLKSKGNGVPMYYAE